MSLGKGPAVSDSAELVRVALSWFVRRIGISRQHDKPVKAIPQSAVGVV
jgi:hypothetical protein